MPQVSSIMSLEFVQEKGKNFEVYAWDSSRKILPLESLNVQHWYCLRSDLAKKDFSHTVHVP